MQPTYTPKLRKPPARKGGIAAPKKPEKKQREEFIYAIGECSLGKVLAAFSEFGLTAVMIDRTKTRLAERLEDRFPKIDLRRDDKAIAKAMTRIVTFIEKPGPTPPDISLDIRGTPFQRRVWQEAAKIRLGETSTYSAIAEAIGSPKSMRAVGSACTNNLFAIIIPCHRVLHTGAGALGKASGRQREFLKREKTRA